jgi:hypothetical protein
VLAAFHDEPQLFIIKTIIKLNLNVVQNCTVSIQPIIPENRMIDPWFVGLIAFLSAAVCASPVGLIAELTPIVDLLHVRGFLLLTSANTTVMPLMEKRSWFLKAKHAMMIRDDCTEDLFLPSADYKVALESFFDPPPSDFIEISY